MFVVKRHVEIINVYFDRIGKKREQEIVEIKRNK